MGGTLSMFGTFSKSPQAWGFEEHTRAISGNGSHIVLNDNQTYIDWVCGLGTNLLGYGNNDFVESVVRQVELGSGFSLPHYIEDLVAEKLVKLLVSTIPYWLEMTSTNFSARFAKTGSEANSMAIRLARAFTNKDIILHSGYGGWMSEFVAADYPAYGIPINYKRDIQKFDFNADLGKFAHRGDVAAVMLEQGIVDPKDGWYDYLREFCNENNALLIIDEVVTGLRYGLGGASEIYDIKPDIVTMGKGLGNGFAVSAVIASEDIMSLFDRDDPVFCSSTHWGEAVSLCAANKMLDLWDMFKVQHIYEIGNLLINGIRNSGWDIVGHAPRSLMIFDDKYTRAFFVQEMRKRGILMNRPNFVSYAHSEKDVEQTIRAAQDIRETFDNKGMSEIISSLSEEQIPRVLFSRR